MVERRVTLPSETSMNDSMLQCCRCEKLLDDPQQLRCLHSCCRSCVTQSAAEAESGCSSPLMATCPKCDEMSETNSNGFLDCRLRRHKAIARATECGMCSAGSAVAAGGEDADAGAQPAEVWCAMCLMSFCATCVLWHGRFYRAHETIQLQNVQNWDKVSPLSTPSCGSHHKAFHVACFTCRASKCPDCWASCGEQRHDVKPLGSPAVASHLDKVKGVVSGLEQALLKKAEVLTPRINIGDELAVGLERDLQQLKRRKLRLVAEIDAACVVVEQRLREAYDVLQAKAAVMSRTAATSECKVRQATAYSRYVVQADMASELVNQEESLTVRMTFLSTELDKLKRPLAVRECIAFESTLPDDDEQMAELAASWIGTPLLMTDDLCSRSQVKRCSTPSDTKAAALRAVPFTTVLLPLGCRDVRATEDDRLLVAAGESGLLEYSLRSGGQLSHWLAPKKRNGQSNVVLSVEALRDGRVAVGAAWDRLVMLLLRTDGEGHAGVRWIEVSRIQSLPGPPLCLSAHEDVLLVATNVGSGGLLTLVSLNNGWQAGSLKCDYNVAGVALTELVILTASSDAVTLGKGRRSHVVEAHMRHSYRKLWFCELFALGFSNMWNICVDAAGRTMQVTACASPDHTDGSGHQLITISVADGSMLRSEAISVNVRPPLDKLLVTRSGKRIVVVASCASVSGALNASTSAVTR